jgi:hypothetical protein
MLWTSCCFVGQPVREPCPIPRYALQFLLHTLYITGLYLLGFQLNVLFRLAGPLRLADLFLLHLVRIEPPSAPALSGLGVWL